jgi:S1-C subfamily serine protease
MTDQHMKRRMSWWQPAALLAGAIAILLCGATLGWTLLHGQLAGRTAVVRLADPVLLGELTEVERQLAQWLANEIDQVQEVLTGDQCTAPRRLDVASVRPSVADRIARATVGIAVTKPGGTTFGTGFFVTPDRVVTSDRLVEAATDVSVMNDSFGTKPARIAARSIGRADFALLVVDGAEGEPLPLRNEAVVGGTVHSPRFIPFHAKPLYPALSSGHIGATQTLSTGLPVIAHTVAVSASGAGSPLIDRCASVIGVHAADYVTARYAIGIPALANFLKAQGVPFTTADGACAPDGPGK